MDYQRYCKKNKAKPAQIVRSPSVFHRERRAFPVSLLAAYASFWYCSTFLLLRDQYTSPKIIRLKELEDEKLTIDEKKTKSASDKKKLLEIEEEMAPLEKFLKDAQTHRLAIKSETGAFILCCSLSFSYLDSLRTDATKAVIVLDFTKFGIVDEGNVHCFVVAVLTRGSDTDAKSGT